MTGSQLSCGGWEEVDQWNSIDPVADSSVLGDRVGLGIGTDEILCCLADESFKDGAGHAIAISYDEFSFSAAVKRLGIAVMLLWDDIESEMEQLGLGLCRQLQLIHASLT